ncbi:hypothetical protein Mrose_00126 [Calidithermus roseus]|uniref:Uncharacterized protein n=1 Tax=Calidithermus roseus TaxID=1644118 RepID=A0A399F5L1_9DEIN|nr:hypothetical protein Mrose_00126 [Calidithermus roseus]
MVKVLREVPVKRGVIVVAMLLGLALAQSQPQIVRWGEYTVRIESRSPTESLLRIIRADRTQVEIRGVRFETQLVELTGQEPRELWINENSGGTNCCTTAYFFTQERSFRNMLIYYGRSTGILELRDVNGDKIPEVIVGTDVFADFGGLPRAVYPRLTYLLGWDGVRYVDVTARYPTLGFSTLSFYRQSLESALKTGDGVGARSAALGYYARGLINGQAAEARDWISKNTPAEVRRWLFDLEGEVLRALYADLGCRLTVSYSKVLPPKPVCAN